MRAPLPGADPVHVDDAIKTRRSHKLFNGTPVAATTVRELLELAIWAPNHKRTEPWRFAVARGPRLAELADASAAMLAPLGDKAQGKIDKTRAMLQSAGAVIAVSQVRSPQDPERDREDYAAVACAIEHVMLGAVARDLVSYWTTSGALIGKALSPFWQVGPGEDLVGAVVIGGPLLTMPAMRIRSVDDVTRWL
jgi:nitroreductase